MLAVVFKPIAAFLFFGVFCLGIRWLVFRFFPEGKVKTIMLKHRWGPRDSLSR